MRGPLTIGAELELLAFDAVTLRPAPVASTDGRACSLDVVREVARRLGWCEHQSDKGVPRFTTLGAGSLTFEPGGQLEYASAVHGSVHAVVRELNEVDCVLRDAAQTSGITLLACGVDPWNGPAQAPLQVDAPRYRRMADYFEAIGPAGARMMRQTASLQLNVGGVSVIDRWRVANAMSPLIVALCANSARYAGADTRCASYRADTWRAVDPRRTGLFAGDDPVREYTAFALDAPAFLADDAAAKYGELPEASVSPASFATHLTTLFPEVRPRGYLELRSADAIDALLRAAALSLVVGILGDDRAARDAGDLLGAADADLLVRAGRDGLRDARLASLARDLVAIADAGCARIGCEVVSADALDAFRTLESAAHA